ncbi:MAG: alpha/beta fold hydrolase [Gaiellales bacterium]
MAHLHDLPDGARIAYDDVGTGRPVVLIHGVSMSRRFFERNAGPLCERFRVLNVDLRGHGESPPHEGGHTVAQYARDVRHLLEGLGLDDAVLVGWSMGSLVIWDMIRQFGADGLAGHVVVSQSPSGLRRPGWELSGLTLDALHEMLAAGQADYRSLMEEFVPAMLMDEPSAADLELLVRETQTVGPNAGTCILLNQSLQDYRDLVGTYRLPTLLTWGRDEKMIRVASGEWLAERIPADLVIFERSGHCPMWEEPDRFNRVVSDWISAL